MENTPMALAILELQKEQRNVDTSNPHGSGLNRGFVLCINILKKYLPKEKEAIATAWDMGSEDDFETNKIIINGDDYFQTVYIETEGL